MWLGAQECRGARINDRPAIIVADGEVRIVEGEHEAAVSLGALARALRPHLGHLPWSNGIRSERRYLDAGAAFLGQPYRLPPHRTHLSRRTTGPSFR
jgi:hypothetical protein